MAIKSDYNTYAGHSLERLAALSDGIFAVAMTLLVLDLHTPLVEQIHSEAMLQRHLIQIAPSLMPYLMSFMTLGIFWTGQQAQLAQFSRSDRHLSWIHLGFLLCVTLMPFTTELLGKFLLFRTALVLYWFNIFLLGAFLFFSWKYATKAKLASVAPDSPVSKALLQRIRNYQLAYAVAVSLCVFSNYASLALLILIQLNAAVAPRFRGRKESDASS